MSSNRNVGQMRKTVLLQESIMFPTDAVKLFQGEKKMVSYKLPLVAIPNDRLMCSCILTVPTGPYCIMHRFGKDVDRKKLADTGLRCSPSCNRIAYCVTQQVCTYNAPVKSCPTQDNVMVDCDLTLMFIIGPKPEAVRNFVYYLGARRFDEFLYAAVEEGIRHLIRTCLHTEVYELRGKTDPRVVKTLFELNRKFTMFGVKFIDVAVTDVRFKPGLQKTLQSTTEYKSRVEEEIKKQTNLLIEIENKSNLRKKELQKTHDRIKQDLLAERARVVIERDTLKTKAFAEQEIAVVHAKEKAQVKRVKFVSEKNVAKEQGLRLKAERVMDITAIAKSKTIKVKQECATKIFESESRLKQAQFMADSTMAEAEAEEAASEGLKYQREHALRLLKLKSLGEIAGKSKLVVAGEVGDRVLNTIFSQDILGSMNLK